MTAPPPALAKEKNQAGIDFGGFNLTPSLTLSTRYDDNIYTKEDNPKGDLITRIAPHVTAAHKAPGTSLVFKAGAEQLLYANDSDDNALNYSASLKARYDWTDEWRWDGLADYRRKHLRRGDNDADPGNEASAPLPYDIYRLSTALTYKNASWEIRPDAGYTRYDYGTAARINGGDIDQDARDRDEIRLGGRIRYALHKGLKLVLEGHFLPRRYDDSGPAGRSAAGGEYLAGLRFDDGTSWWAEAMAGYLYRDYDRDLYDDIDAPGARAGLTWTYAPDSRLRVRLGRSIAEVTEDGAGGALRTDIQATLRHSFSDDLRGKIGARYIVSDYKGGAAERTDHYYKLSAGLSYTLSERIVFNADYAYVDNDSNKDTSDYQSNIVTTGLTFGF